MARSALTQLQSQIEAIRREAYAAGYAAAMQVIQKAAGGTAAAAASTPRRRGAAKTAKPAAAPAAKPARTAKPARAGRPARAAKPARAAAKPAASAARPTRRRGGRAAAAKPAAGPRRGNNAAMIEEILKGMAPRAARPAEIRTALQRDKGAAVAFTSIRHALGQLEARQAIEQVGDSKTWRAKS